VNSLGKEDSAKLSSRINMIGVTAGLDPRVHDAASAKIFT